MKFSERCTLLDTTKKMYFIHQKKMYKVHTSSFNGTTYWLFEYKKIM